MRTENVKKVEALGLDTFNVSETMGQLKAGGVVMMMSWGCRGFTNFGNKGLLFRVSGFKHKGYVLITLAFDDTYTIHLLTIQCEVVKTIENVYCDELTRRIDSEVEKVDNYEQKVKQTYDWK